MTIALRIAWRDLAGWSCLDEVLVDLTELADACIVGALKPLNRWAAEEYGSGKQKPKSSLVVLGMGKLGAHELNFSSDIDLIFAYPDTGDVIDTKTKRIVAEWKDDRGGRIRADLHEHLLLGEHGAVEADAPRLRRQMHSGAVPNRLPKAHLCHIHLLQTGQGTQKRCLAAARRT